MNDSTFWPVSVSTPATRSSRMVVWNLRRIETTMSVSPSSTRRRSPLFMLFWVTQTTTFSRMVVLALFGPRPVYSANNRTTRLLIAAAREPGVRSCVSVLAMPASGLISLWGTAARKTEGNGENPTDGFRHHQAYPVVSTASLERLRSAWHAAGLSRVDESQAIGQAAELEQPLHGSWAGDQPEGDAVRVSRGMPVEDEMQSGRVQEANLAQVEDQAREAGGAQLAKLALDRRHRREVDLADRTDVDSGAARLDLAAKWFELGTGK